MSLPEDNRRILPLPSEFDFCAEYLYGEDCSHLTWKDIKTFDVEIDGKIEKHAEGARCFLYNGHAHKYCFHAVTGIIQFLRLERFSHISFEAAASVLDPYRPGYSVGWHSAEFFLHRWADEFGLWCRRCREVKFGFVDRWHLWDVHEMCADCIIDARQEGHQALRRQREQKAFERRMQENQEQARMASQKRSEEAKRRRQLERAAYEVLSEMGIINQLEIKDARSNDGHARKDGRKKTVVVRKKSARPLAQSHAG
jgi:hypothetical protein